MKMLRSIRIAIFFILFLNVVCNQYSQAFADEEGKEFINNEENPSLPKIIWRTLGERFPPRSWELVQTAMHKIKMKFYPPNLDFKSDTEENDAGERVMKAAKKSLESSKETVEESAKMAGGVVGEAVQVTAEKVKNKASDPNSEDPNDEL